MIIIFIGGQFSSGKVVSFGAELKIGKSLIVTLENRKDVFSITVGDYTLEGSWPYPPTGFSKKS